MKRFRSSLLAAAAMLVATTAIAQEFPNKPVKVIVPYAAGGLPDTMARLIGQHIGDSFGQQFIVENRGGAGGISGTDAVAKAPADGYTLLIADVGQLAINPFLYKKLPYDSLKDFAPISLMGTSPLYLVIHPSVPANNLQELIALVKAKPGQFNYGSAGTGSIHHLTMESFKAAFGLQITHVPYKGSGQSVPALLGGQVNMLPTALPSMAAHVKAGKVKLIAISTLKRSAQAPDVPAIAELVPGFDFVAEIGILAPAGTPAAIVNKISAEIPKVLKLPDIVQRFTALGIDPVGSTPEFYAANIRAALDKYSKAVKISGAQAQD